MDHILEDVQFEEFFKELKEFMNRSVAQKASWQNPSIKRLVGLLVWSEWHREHPEQSRVFTDNARVASRKSRGEHPEKTRANLEKFQAGSKRWWEENREEARAIRASNMAIARTHIREMNAAALLRWQKETSAEVLLAVSTPGRIAATRKDAQRYSGRLQVIKAAIPKTGIRFCELQKLFPQWSLRKLLQRAVRCRDVIKVGKYCGGKYYLQGKESL